MIKKKISPISCAVIFLTGITLSSFIYDIKFNLYANGIKEKWFFLALSLIVIALLYVFWLVYSKVVSLLLKKDFSKLLRNDAITYLPFLLLIFSPLRSLFIIPGKFASFSVLFSFILLIFSA